MISHPTYVLLVFAAATVVGAIVYFRCWRLTRPPVGVMNLWDVGVLIAGIILVPYLYLALPPWMVGGLLALAAASALYFLFEAALPSRAAVWVVVGLMVGADVLAARGDAAAFPGINNTLLILVVIGITNLWGQSGLKARDLAILALFLTAYDLIATLKLPLTADLFARLAKLPFAPMMTWPAGAGRWVGLGLGDLLMAAAFPVVLRKAYGRAASVIGAALALAALAALALLADTGHLPPTFPVMVVLGPLIVAQYAAWRRFRGPERTTQAYLIAEPMPDGPRHGGINSKSQAPNPKQIQNSNEEMTKTEHVAATKIMS